MPFAVDTDIDVSKNVRRIRIAELTGLGWAELIGSLFTCMSLLRNNGYVEWISSLA